ncbi:Aspartyl aminopeptidase isoform 2 [Schistosoma japonicum]|uniref:Aspartyl aminopeptidase n=1 Tax=Schistosoma japonicum TaxID=6182 RepID=A0A4Z2D149_SCHJA|nr:Aspartyl aminopeptidase isoform 2 [Schistosoma japonicum]
MTQPQPSDINRDLPLNPQTQNTTNHSNPNSNLFTSAPEEQEKCDFPSPHFCEQDSKFQWNSVQEPSGVSPLSSPSILETHLGRECVTERTSDTDTKNSSSPITFGSPFSPSTSLNSQLHCIPTTVYSNAITSVTTITSVRRPRHKPAERRELLELAVNDVLGSQISMRRAAQKYNLAKSSLCDYVRKNGIILPNLRFKSYQTIPRSTATDLSVSNRKITLSANTSRQTPGSCKRSGSPLVGNVCTSSVSSLPTKLSCGITRKVNITRTKNMDNTKQHPKISAKPIIHMNNLSLGMDNSRAASIASTCDVNSIRPLTLCDRTGNDSCPSEICLPVHHHANNQGNLFNLSNISKCLTNVISCKAGRIESPWHNAAGLPTQVPMRSWMGPNTLSGSLQNANRQDQQQPINMRSLSSFIASSSGIVSGQLHCDQEDSMTNNDSLTKTKLNHASLSVNMNTPFQSTNNYLNALTENSNESLTDCSQGLNHFLPNETKSLGDKISSRQNFLLFGDCCCPANPSDTNFPADSRQLATTLFWSSLGSKAVDLLSTIGSDIFQQQQQQANTSNSSNFPIIHTTTLTPTSVAVTKCGVNNFPIDLLNNNITSNQVNFCRNTESVKVHRPTPSISSTASPALLLNSDLLKNQLLSLHSSNSNMSYHVQGLINFINKSPTPFHVIQLVRTFLGTHGFRELLEDEPWTLRPLDKVYVTKNESTVIVAAVGGRFETGNGFTLLGAHTDSPCLRLKPNSERLKEGYIQLGVETYGGGLWYTWFDRELTLAGRVIIRNSEGRLEQRLVHINNPIACVPSLAIHLNQEIKTQGFHPNSEQHLSPILCTSLMEQLQNPTVQSLSTTDCVSDSTNTCFNLCPVSLSERHHHPPALLRLLSEETGVSEQQIVELELYFADAQPACVGGLYKEFIHAPRLDNLFNSYAGLHGFIESLPTLSSECNMRLLCLFDHEEVGSTSTQGADSGYTLSVIRRLCKAFEMSSTSNIPTSNNPNTPHSKYNLDLNFEQSLAKSFLVSADQAHAVHPSWSERHECYHKPQFHGGVVLKYNVSQRYATNGLTAAVVREIAHLSNVPVQVCGFQLSLSKLLTYMYEISKYIPIYRPVRFVNKD